MTSEIFNMNILSELHIYNVNKNIVKWSIFISIESVNKSAVLPHFSKKQMSGCENSRKPFTKV